MITVGSVGRYKSAWLFTAAFVILLAVTLWMAVRALQAEVRNTSEAANITLTRALVNANWEAIHPMLMLGEDVERVKANPSLPAVEGLVRAFSRGTDLVKVKIYDLKGLTVYSSDPAQIGEDKSSNLGFVQATKGRVVSEINYRGKFGGFDGDLYQRNLVSSYVPVYSPRGVEAVVEVYTDRTDSMGRVERRVIELSLSLAALLCLVLGLLYGSTRHQKPALPSPADSAAKADPPQDHVGAVCHALARQLAGSLDQRSRALQALSSAFRDTAPDSAQIALVNDVAALSAAEATQAQRLSWLSELLEGHPTAGAPAFDLKATIAAIFQQHAEGAKQDGFEVQQHMSPELPTLVTGDHERTARLIDLLLQMLRERAASGVLQMKAQMGPRGVQLDLISSRCQKSHIETLEMLLVERLAQHIGGEVRIQTRTENGDWLTLMLPQGQAVES